MMTHRSSGMAVAFLCIVSLALLSAGPLNARGLRPPPFSGGNAGAWLNAGSLFDPQHPLGPDFFIPTDFGGGIGGFEWNDGGTSGTGGNGHGPGCKGDCLTESWTGPCKKRCQCLYGHERPTDMLPTTGSTVYGTCIDLGAGNGNDIGGCVDPNTAGSFVVQ